MAPTRREFLAGAAAVGGAALWCEEAAAQAPAAQAAPTRQEVEAAYTGRRNWGRWGPDDQRGAVNLITPQKRVAATKLVARGRTVSLSRPFEPEQQFTRITEDKTGGSVIDYYGFIYHGTTVTHIDALGHVWDQHGMWNGRKPAEVLDTRGAHFADITAFSDGLVTRGVLLDVPRHRGQPHVTVDRPVQGAELDQIARAQKVSVTAGDALLVYSGREAFQRGGNTYGSANRPGLHPTCAAFIRDHDVSILGWDMMDARPDGYGLRWPVHGVLFNYGVVLLDNALLEPLAAACAEEGRYEFLFVALPLRVPRGTGSPANPVAIF
jgi:kynurenine formamidase